MHIFVVNLDRSPDRMVRMESLLGGMGLDACRVAAVDGDSLSEGDRQRWVGQGGGPYNLEPGEIGCFLSHRKCWEMLLSGNDSHVVVLEDDIHLGARVHELLSAVDWIPPDADLVKLETSLKRTFFDKRPAVVVGGRGVKRLYGQHLGTAGYIVSRKGARKLIDMSSTFTLPVDMFMFDPSTASSASLTIYQVEPAVCIQDENLTRGGSSATLRSTLYGERRRHSPVGMAKLMREIFRPVRQALFLLRATYSNILTTRHCERIEFR